MTIQEIIKRIKETYTNKDYQVAIEKYLLEQNGQELENCEISAHQADMLVEALNGTVEHDRSEIDTWIKNNFDEKFEGAANDAKQSSLEDLIKSENSEWDKEYAADSDFNHILPIGNVVNSNGIAYCIGRPCPLEVNRVKPQDQTGEILRDYVKYFNQNFEVGEDESAILLVPLSVGAAHWVLGKISMKAGVPQSAELYDSMSGGNSGYVFFKLFMCALGINFESITYEFRGDQSDNFRCFDYVCKEIAVFSGQVGHPLASLSGEALRQKVAEMIAEKQGVELVAGSTSLELAVEGDFASDLSEDIDSDPGLLDAAAALPSISFISDTSRVDASRAEIHSIDDQDAINAVGTLRAILSKQLPESCADLGDSGFAISALKDDGGEFHFDVSILPGSLSTSLASLAPRPFMQSTPQSTPHRTAISRSYRSDFSSLHKSEDPEDPTVAAEKAFMLHYADSSDEEDEGYDTTSAHLQTQTVEALKKYRKKMPEKFKGGGGTSGQSTSSSVSSTGTAKRPFKLKSSPKKLTQDRANSVSFMLYVLGIMLLRSNKVRPYYHTLKEKQLSMRERDFIDLKHSFYRALNDVFSEKLGQGFDATPYWRIFLIGFRKEARKGNAHIEELFKKSLTLVVQKIVASAEKELIELSVASLYEKIKPDVPVFHEKLRFSISFDKDHQNTQLQLLAVIRLSYRIVHRMFVAGVSGDVDVKSGIHGTDCNTKLKVSAAKKTRNEEMVSRKGTYGSYLGEVGDKEYYATHTTTTINKMRVVHGRTDSVMVEHMNMVVNGTAFDKNKKDRSYRNFLRHMYYLLMQNEVGRNPASLLVSLMMFSMLRSADFDFDRFFPKNSKQKELQSVKPTCRHPMCVEGAPRFSVGLNRRFQVDGFLYRYDTKTCKPEMADKFSIEQYKRVADWYKVENNGANLNEADESAVIAQLSDLAASF